MPVSVHSSCITLSGQGDGTERKGIWADGVMSTFGKDEQRLFGRKWAILQAGKGEVDGRK